MKGANQGARGSRRESRERRIGALQGLRQAIKFKNRTDGDLE